MSEIEHTVLRMQTITAERFDGSDKLSQRSARWALTALSLSILLSSLGTSIANVGLPTFAQVFKAPFQEVQWIILAYLLGITSLIVSVGRLGDIVGRRRLLLVGIFVFTTASALCGIAPTLQWMIIARFAQGAGAAVMLALTLTFVSKTAPKKSGQAMGLLGTMSAIGTALGPTLGGFLITEFGWKGIFLINVPLGALAFRLANRYLPTDIDTTKRIRMGFDFLGTLLLAATLACYSLAVTLGRGHFGLLNVVLLVTSGCGVGLFVVVQSRTANPLIRLGVFRNSALNVSLARNLVVSTVMMATLVVGPFYLSSSFGFNPAVVGLLMSVGPIVTALVSVPAGRLTDCFGTKRTALFGICGVAIGSLALALLPRSCGIFGYIIPIMTMTAGYGLFQTANNSAVMLDLSTGEKGVISGVLNLSRNLGLITGASLMSAIFAFGSGITNGASGPTDVAHGMRIAFAASALFIIVPLILEYGIHVFGKRCQHPAMRESAA